MSSLNEEARDLLLEASRDSAGDVFVTESFDGLSVNANGREFVEHGSARSAAACRGAIRALAQMNLLENRGGDGSLYSLTDHGFEAADQLLAELAANDPHLGSN